MKKILIISTFLLGIISCKKDVVPEPLPKSEFTYVVGAKGKAAFTSVSTNATSYEWNFGDGQTETTKDNFTTHQYQFNRKYQASLTATGLGGKDVKVKEIQVISAVGSLVIYKAFSTRDRNIGVYVDGNFYGQINGSYYFSSAPVCGNQYSITVYDLMDGPHRIEAKETGSNPYSWAIIYNTNAGYCNSQGLSN
jgi:PKD repeat protein